MDSFYSYWENILSGLQQSSILDPLLFNMYISDMFLIFQTNSFAGYTDGNIPFVVKDNITNFIKALDKIGEYFIEEF